MIFYAAGKQRSTSQQLKFLQQHLEQRLTQTSGPSTSQQLERFTWQHHACPRQGSVPLVTTTSAVEYSTVEAAVKYIQRPHLPGRSSSRPPLSFYFLLAVDSTQEFREVINGSEHHGHAAYESNSVKHGYPPGRSVYTVRTKGVRILRLYERYCTGAAVNIQTTSLRGPLFSGKPFFSFDCT